ncbi:MAG: GNAT family N-acetyltransferase [Bacillota bacterium]
MIYVRLTGANFQRLHPRTMDLLRNHGDGRLTLQALRRYASLTAEEVGRPGTFVLTALDHEGRVIAVTAAVRWGHELSVSAVHRHNRGRGLAGTLLRLVVRALGRYYAEVASDNLPSLRAFFACGLVAYDVFTRPNGKIILRLRTVEPVPTDRPEARETDAGGD